ncbi:peptide/nickel transport system substrate-binding protein [Pacificibacter maritimus]|uniref:Peptide/nickel transport system substrate-binding protein n=1 Tax=Pacificibacter maritimus TaxID=762213 RepID=A0A3N4UKG2_9RHOB|nr:ABC transporter substrate-binding protein [Pacificibacter maritimus]RPE70933.1 peptide/nickel transport system substrate-binding protein [Pacificibacter maritimus]
MKNLQKLLSATAVAACMTTSAFALDITIAQTSAVNTLDPHASASVGLDLSVLSHIYPTLLLRAPDYSLQPSLATEWKAIDDLTWQFTLTPDATFANGEKLDAQTVAWNINRVTDADNPKRISSWFSQVESVNVISPTEFQIKTSSPYPALADQLSMFMLLPPEWAEANDPTSETISGFLYEISEYVPGDHITLKPNESYWGDESAKFDSVTFRVIPETASRIASLLAGEVDMINSVPASELARIDASDMASAGAVDSTRSVFIKFNTEKAPLDNKLFRQALNYAVDKDLIAEALFDGRANVSACQVMTPDYFGFNPDLTAYEYDPEKAKQLLEESGVDLSQPIEFELPSGQYLQGAEVTQAVAQMFEDVGVKTEIQSMEFGAYLDKYRKAHDLGRLSLLGQAWATIDADGLLTLFKPGNQYSYWNDATFDQHLIAGGSTTDQDSRLAAYKAATEVMCDEAPVVFLYAQPATYGVSSRVTYQPRGDDWMRAFDMMPAE